MNFPESFMTSERRFLISTLRDGYDNVPHLTMMLYPEVHEENSNNKQMGGTARIHDQYKRSHHQNKARKGLLRAKGKLS